MFVPMRAFDARYWGMASGRLYAIREPHHELTTCPAIAGGNAVALKRPARHLTPRYASPTTIERPR